VQVPSVPASAHDRQVPLQALAQQIPCSHSAELHSAGAAQRAPIGFLPQLPVAQVLGELQSVEVVHDVRQAPPVPQTYGSQVVGVPARQLPAPLQLRAGVNATPTQVDPAHGVPAA
jgi:hypothetical protein